MIDKTPPTISATRDTPDPQEYGSPLLFAATISDDTTLVTVCMEVRDSGGAALANFSMIYNAASGEYESLSAAFSLGAYAYTVWTTET